ncbi:MAG: NAD(P)H-hydrate dehydratase [Clostridia bacterium]|nr:NAD(P)H-hydrate dehydratase [Clostridia bacterium]
MDEIRITEKNISDVISDLYRKRPDKGNKGTFGTLGIIAGSVGFRGCASLACRAALRAGAGIVKLISIEEVCLPAVTSNPEIILSVTGKTPDGLINPRDAALSFGKTSALLIGCGMTVSPETLSSVSAVLTSGIPAVLDADALNSVAASGDIGIIDGAGVIVTPHAGEAARLTGLDIMKLKRNQGGYCADFASKHGCVAVFKDHVTAVSDGKRLAMLDIPNGGMSRGGAGDVLAGVISSLRAQGYGSFEAALLGVCLHSEAGLRAKRKFGDAMLPSDVSDLILQGFIPKGELPK